MLYSAGSEAPMSLSIFLSDVPVPFHVIKNSVFRQSIPIQRVTDQGRGGFYFGLDHLCRTHRNKLVRFRQSMGAGEDRDFKTVDANAAHCQCGRLNLGQCHHDQ